MGHKVPQSQYFHGLWHSFFFSTVKDGIIALYNFKSRNVNKNSQILSAPGIINVIKFSSPAMHWDISLSGGYHRIVHP